MTDREGALEEQGRRSVGSVIGLLESVTVHNRREASIWTERGNHRVTVRFSPEQLGAVREAMGGRVEARGELQRDYRGVPMTLMLAALEVLPRRGDVPPLSDAAGAFPDFTGGLVERAYLESVRGEEGGRNG